jgi:hypothetical protein
MEQVQQYNMYVLLYVQCNMCTAMYALQYPGSALNASLYDDSVRPIVEHDS